MMRIATVDSQQKGATMKKCFLLIPVLAVFCFAACEADAATYTVSQNSGLLTRMCGQYIQGCVWCSNSSGRCYRVTGCSNGTCTIESFITPKGGVKSGTVKSGKPVQAPPPPKGGKTPPRHHMPVNAAPITNGKPVQKSPGTGTTQPILEKGSGGNGKH